MEPQPPPKPPATPPASPPPASAGKEQGGSATTPPVRAPVLPPSPVPQRTASAKPGTPGKGEPAVAAILSWLIPGAGHVYQGQAGLGLLCFLIVEGLYFLGLQLGGGMTFEYLDPELRSTFAPALSPEVGNLGAFIYQMQHYGFGPGFPRVFPEWLRLGSSLAALSGVLNIAVIAHAHWSARTSVRPTKWTESPALGVLATWMIPGLGHWLQGRRKRALVVCALLVGLFVLGTILAEATNLSRERHFYYWSGQFLVGLPAIVAELIWGGARVQHEIPYVDAGLVFGCIAGLLNTLAMIDVYGYAESKLLGLPLRASHAPVEAAP